MDNSMKLGEEKVSTLLLKFSIPAIIGTLVNGLYNIIGRIFVGNSDVGYLGIAGITVVFPIMLILMGFGMLVGVGATALMSIKLGEKDKDGAELIMGNGMTLLILASLSISILGLVFIDPLLKMCGASQNVLPYAKDYLQIILIGAVFSSVGFGMNNFIRAGGNPNMAMLTMIIGSVISIILSPIFIYVFKWGVKGAALATVVAQIVSAIWVVLYFIKGKSVFKIHIKNLKLNWMVVKKILLIGMAPFAMQVAASILGIIMNKSLEYYGQDIAVSAMGIVNSISMLIFMPIIGITQGAQPIIGFNYGAHKYDRVKHVLKLASIAATCVVSVGFAINMSFPTQIISLFGKDNPEVIEMGVMMINIFLLLLPVVGFQMVGSQYFQAVGKPKQAMILTLSRQVLLLIPLLIVLPKFFGIYGLLYSGPISDLGAALITGIWLNKEINHLQEKHELVSSQ